MGYRVMVGDNYDIESRDYCWGVYDTPEEALAVARKIVDDFLKSTYELQSQDDGKVTADGLNFSYRGFGEDPYIIADSGDSIPFSAWDYAEQRCRDIVNGLTQSSA